jgi:hypothetical protein
MVRDKREAIIRLVVSESEKAELQASADKAGIPLAVWVRAAALAAARGGR